MKKHAQKMKKVAGFARFAVLTATLLGLRQPEYEDKRSLRNVVNSLIIYVIIQENT
jgi:hypothetical protein